MVIKYRREWAEKKWGWAIIFVHMKRGGSRKAMQHIGGWVENNYASILSIAGMYTCKI